MADTKNTGSEEPSKSPPPVEVEPLSDDDLDQAISEADPEFLKSISEIGNDKSLSLSQIVVSDADQALSEAKEAWAKSGPIGRLLFKLMPFLPLLSLKLRKVRVIISDFLRAEWIRAKNFLYFLATDGKNKFLGTIKAGINAVVDTVVEWLRQFRYLSWKLKLSFFGLLIFGATTVFIIYRSLTTGFVPIHNELFIPSIERIATEVFEYDPATEVEPFYENLRAPQSIIMMPKMVVNLKRSSKSGPNPMGAFEFFIEGMAPEVVIEIKDREVEIRDRIQRTLEDFNFDQADSPEGKKMICEKIQKEVNLVLTTGKIKRVWLKTAILKP